MTEQELKQAGFIWYSTDQHGILWAASPLIYHIALYKNPDMSGHYEERYCFANLATAKAAVDEQARTGEMRLWQKWHNKGISITGRHAYPDGAPHSPKYALYEVDWDATAISEAAIRDW